MDFQGIPLKYLRPPADNHGRLHLLRDFLGSSDSPTGDMMHYTETYKIVRHFAPHLDREKEIIDTGLSLEEAQEHCQDPDTREEGEWFDGYTEE